MSTVPRRCGGCLAVIACASITLGEPQIRGRFDETKRLGLIYIKNGQYDKAAGKLEEVWEMQKPSDPLVAENLAVAYLNGEDRKSQRDLDLKAFGLMEQAISGGGQATLLVLHSHEKLGLIQGNALTKFCSGRLSIKSGHLAFISEAGDHAGEDSFEFSAADFNGVEPNRDNSRGMFHIKGKDKRGKERTYNMVPKSWARNDSDFFLSLIRKHLQN